MTKWRHNFQVLKWIFLSRLTTKIPALFDPPHFLRQTSRSAFNHKLVKDRKKQRQMIELVHRMFQAYDVKHLQ